MNREEHDSQGGVMEYNRRERRRLSARGIVEAFCYVSWLLLVTTIVSTFVVTLFAVRFWSACVIVSGTIAAVLSATYVAKSRKPNRPGTGDTPGSRRIRMGEALGGRTVSVGAVLGEMVVFLILDFALTVLLEKLAINIIMAHMLMMVSGIVLGGAMRVLSERAPTIGMSVCGGFFTSFVLTLLVFGDFQPGVSFQGLPDAVSAAIHILLILFFVALLFKSSHALASQATWHSWP